MTIAVAVKKINRVQNDTIVLADVTLDSSYPTGGEAVTPAQFGLTGIDSVICGSPPLGGFLATWDSVNSKIKLFQSTTGTPALLVEVADMTSAATAVVPVVVFGF